jgi:formylglycine-generating enzyme required for sulfatase activity
VPPTDRAAELLIEPRPSRPRRLWRRKSPNAVTESASATTPYHCDSEDIRLYANLADQSADTGRSSGRFESWSDGHIIHSPVASFRANAFGLFDTHGNVWEWTTDLYLNSPMRILRGGGFQNPAANARTTQILQNVPQYVAGDVGMRPARELRVRE